MRGDGNLLLVPHAAAGIGELLCWVQIGRFSFSLCAAEERRVQVNDRKSNYGINITITTFLPKADMFHPVFTSGFIRLIMFGWNQTNRQAAFIKINIVTLLKKKHLFSSTPTFCEVHLFRERCHTSSLKVKFTLRATTFFCLAFNMIHFWRSSHGATCKHNKTLVIEQPVKIKNRSLARVEMKELHVILFNKWNVKLNQGGLAITQPQTSVSLQRNCIIFILLHEITDERTISTTLLENNCTAVLPKMSKTNFSLQKNKKK